ncbi:MAG: hypothetical protein ACYCX4_00390 [Bacillota bacterium]
MNQMMTWDDMIWFFIKVISGLWLYSKLVQFLGRYIYPWVFKFTWLLGIIAPKTFRFIYHAPFQGGARGWMGWLFYFLCPVAVLFMVYIIVLFYFTMAKMAQDSFENDRPCAGIAHIALILIVATLHGYLTWHAPLY